MGEVLLVVQGGGSEAQPLGSARHRRVVDRLHVDPVPLQQLVRHPLAQHRIPDEHGDDVRRVGHDRQPRLPEHPLQPLREGLLAAPLDVARLEMAHAREGARGDRGRYRRGEDEPGGMGADEVDERGGARDVAAHHPERLGEGALDHRDPIHHPLARRDAGAARAVHPDRVYLVQVGHCAVTVREVAHRRDRRHVPIHRVDRFEGHNLGLGRVEVRERVFEVGEVVVGEDALLRPGVADAGDHGRVVPGVREEDAPRELAPEGGEGGLVGGVAGAEEERRLGSVEVRELLLEQHVAVRGAGDVPGTPGARAVPVDRVLHRPAHDLVLAHAEVVVGAPDGDLERAGGGVADGPGEAAGPPFQIREDPVSALRLQVLDPVGEEAFVVQGLGPRRVRGSGGRTAGRHAGRAGAGMVTGEAASPRVGRARLRQMGLRRNGRRKMGSE